MSERDLWLEAYLASVPGARCPACDGAVSAAGRCTGCRRHVVVGLAAIGEMRVAWTLALAGLFLIMGIGAVSVLLLILRADRLRQFGVTAPVLAMAAAGGMALAGALLMMRYRKAICGWERLGRVALTVGIYAVLVLEGVMMGSLNR